MQLCIYNLNWLPGWGGGMHRQQACWWHQVVWAGGQGCSSETLAGWRNGLTRTSRLVLSRAWAQEQNNYTVAQPGNRGLERNIAASDVALLVDMELWVSEEPLSKNEGSRWEKWVFLSAWHLCDGIKNSVWFWAAWCRRGADVLSRPRGRLPG